MSNLSEALNATRVLILNPGNTPNNQRKSSNAQKVKLRSMKRSQHINHNRDLKSNREWANLNDRYQPQYTLGDLPDLISSLNYPSDESALFSAQGFRKLLCIEHNLTIQQVIDAGLIPVLINWLERRDFPQLQYEAAWALISISSGNFCEDIIEKGIIPVLTHMLLSSDIRVTELAQFLNE